MSKDEEKAKDSGKINRIANKDRLAKIYYLLWLSPQSTELNYVNRKGLYLNG